MAEDLKELIRRIVGEVMDTHLGDMRADLTKRVTKEVLAAVAAANPPGASATDQLNGAVASIQDTTSQSEILKAFLDGAAKFSGRTALFVVRGGSASGWQARGFNDEASIKAMHVDINHGLAGRAVNDRAPVAAAAAEFDNAMVSEQGNPHDGNAVVLPLVVKEKVAALIYADAGTETGGSLDVSALHVLSRSASLWLEMLTLRKAGGAAAVAEHSPADGMIAPPERVTESVSTLTASAPAEKIDDYQEAARAAEKAREQQREAETAREREAEEARAKEQEAVRQREADAAEAAAKREEKKKEPAEIAPEDQEVHKKAKRFAKLLVDEIKLYNKKKVEEGREHRDLYKRLREDIDKSRASYEKRFGHTAAKSADYFTAEILRVLANNDVSLMGNDYPS